MPALEILKLKNRAGFTAAEEAGRAGWAEVEAWLGCVGSGAREVDDDDDDGGGGGGIGEGNEQEGVVVEGDVRTADGDGDGDEKKNGG